MTVQNFGTALGDGFVLNEATLMIGPLGSAMDLTEEKHSFWFIQKHGSYQ